MVFPFLYSVQVLMVPFGYYTIAPTVGILLTAFAQSRLASIFGPYILVFEAQFPAVQEIHAGGFG
ncbi:hypothetical protein SDC9_187554 [bioreactor metagenome]|uniref:Uncharacterized protein n=1 Tax=bioreactor metagenome TaxID=1076179 RepID=A0A645HP57_9ZZZZ